MQSGKLPSASEGNFPDVRCGRRVGEMSPTRSAHCGQTLSKGQPDYVGSSDHRWIQPRFGIGENEALHEMCELCNVQGVLLLEWGGGTGPRILDDYTDNYTDLCDWQAYV